MKNAEPSIDAPTMSDRDEKSTKSRCAMSEWAMDTRGRVVPEMIT